MSINWKVATSHPRGGPGANLCCMILSTKNQTDLVTLYYSQVPEGRQAGFILFEFFQDKNAHKSRTLKYFFFVKDRLAFSICDGLAY